MEEGNSPLKQIRTFQGDVAEALGKEKPSLVSIQRAEHAKYGAPTPESSAKGRRNQFFFLSSGSLILLVLGGLGAWFAYSQFLKQAVSPIVATPDNQFFSVNSDLELVVATSSRETLIQETLGKTREIPATELAQITLKTRVGDKVLSSTDLFRTLQTKASSQLLRAFDPLFMLGAIGANSTTSAPSTFIIIKLTSFENAFAGMFAWEPNLLKDLGPLFSTTPTIEELAFTDVTDRNKDVRVLGPSDEPVLLYTFFESEFLIITDSLETLHTLVEDLTREKLSR